MYYLCQAIVPFYDDYGHNMTYTLLSDGTKSTYCFPIKNYIYRMFYQLYLDPVAEFAAFMHLSRLEILSILETEAGRVSPPSLDGILGYASNSTLFSL